MAMGTFAMAGGDIAPVEPVVETPMVEESTGAFYVGIAYGLANYDASGTDYFQTRVDGTWSEDVDYDTVMLQAGYKFNPYVALEGRYWIGFDEDVNVDETINIDTWGIYVKPMYPVTEAFDIYGLLGYASSDMESSYPGGSYPAPDMDGFSWGLGASYAFSDNLSVFVDYTDMYDDSDTVTYGPREVDDIDSQITSWNFGVTYTF
ncbi:MAG TPA: porin family protein [Sulfurovum sp.]|nr:porin family protein [Sulfurovum sp.]